MYFEVTIPDGPGAIADSVLQIEASSWARALEAALAHAELGDGRGAGDFADISADAVRVTIAAIRRTVRVREIDDATQVSAGFLQAITSTDHITQSENTSSPKVGVENPKSGRFQTIGAGDVARADAQATVIQETRHSGSVPAVSAEDAQKAVQAGQAQPAEAAAETEDDDDLAGVSDNALEEVFLESNELFSGEMDTAQAATFVMNLATEFIPCSHAVVLFADANHTHFECAATSGEGFDALFQTPLPIDKGIASFSHRNGVSLAINDPRSDRRYDDALAKATGLDERAVLCCPIQHGERGFGVLMLFNRSHRDRGFTQFDNNIVTYIAGQMGRFVQESIDASVEG